MHAQGMPLPIPLAYSLLTLRWRAGTGPQGAGRESSLSLPCPQLPDFHGTVSLF